MADYGRVGKWFERVGGRQMSPPSRHTGLLSGDFVFAGSISPEFPLKVNSIARAPQPLE